MGLAVDRALSQALRYAEHHQTAATPTARHASRLAWQAFLNQFDGVLRDRLVAVYTAESPLFDDRRIRCSWRVAARSPKPQEALV